MQLDIQTPRAFAPLLFPNRYKGAFGGRGSAKSHFFGESLVEKHVMLPGSRSVCIREVQKSLEQSSKKLIEDKIKKLKVQHLFRVLDDKIITPGNGIIIFAGMQNHTADSIKSLESFGTAWVDEAQALSRHSLKILRPTIRAPGSEIWFSWNPAKPSDPVDDFFRGSGAGRKNAICVEANWRDNPWFPPELEADRQEDLRLIPEEYDHIWEGGYITITESLIFKGRVSVEPFETPANARFHFGADFGFARDPSTLIRAWLRDKCL
jgi:phage terminase large subunit